MKTSQAFPSQWLSHDDAEPAIVVTIATLTQEEVGQKKELKPVLWFKELSKGLVVNKTNWQACVKICGSDDSDDWAGKSVELYAALVQFAGEEMQGIRVRAPKPQKAPDNVKQFVGNAIKQQDAGGAIGVQIHGTDGVDVWARVTSQENLDKLKAVGGDSANFTVRQRADGKWTLVTVERVRQAGDDGPPQEFAEQGRGVPAGADDIPF